MSIDLFCALCNCFAYCVQGKTKIKSAYLNLQQANRLNHSLPLSLFVSYTYRNFNFSCTLTQYRAPTIFISCLSLYFALFQFQLLSQLADQTKNQIRQNSVRKRKRRKKINNSWLPQLTLWAFALLPTQSLFFLSLCHTLPQ